MKKVLVVSTIKGIAGRNCLTGIFDYVNSGRDWSIRFLQDPDDIAPEIMRAAVREGVDGIVVSYNRRTRSFEELLRIDVPVVQVHDPCGDSAGLRPRFALLRNDDIRVGEVAAEYFRSKGAFRAYAYLPTDEHTTWSDLHRDGFANALAKYGETVREPGHDEPLADFLRSLPRPAALFCATDPVALNTVSVCRRLRLAIPTQIAILGVDDDEMLCGASRPSLSSVHTDDFGLGRLAARELDRLMRGGRQKGTVVLCVPPSGVTERDSTRAVPPAGHLIREALAFIDSNPSAGVADVARHLGVSHPLLRRRFREIHGSSLRDEIAARRMSLAVRLLRETDEPVARIAKRCGFASACRFNHAFRQLVGAAPLAVRNGAAARLSPQP